VLTTIRHLGGRAVYYDGVGCCWGRGPCNYSRKEGQERVAADLSSQVARNEEPREWVLRGVTSKTNKEPLRVISALRCFPIL
jgi:hypothetical protein